MDSKYIKANNQKIKKDFLLCPLILLFLWFLNPFTISNLLDKYLNYDITGIIK